MKRWIPYTAMALVIVAAIVISVHYHRQTERQLSENADLEDQVEELQQKIDQLEKEKESLQDEALEAQRKRLDDVRQSLRELPTLRPIPLPDYMPDPNRSSVPSSGNGVAVVVYRKPSCDYFILENASGYIVAEWMGGNDPDLGDQVTGDFHSFGTKDFFNVTRDTDSRLWIDDYMLSKGSALEKIMEECQ